MCFFFFRRCFLDVEVSLLRWPLLLRVPLDETRSELELFFMGDAFDSDGEGSGSAVAGGCFVDDDDKAETAAAFDSFAAAVSEGFVGSAVGLSYSSSKE